MLPVIYDSFDQFGANVPIHLNVFQHFAVNDAEYWTELKEIRTLVQNGLTLSCIMLKNGQTHFNNLAV